MGLVGWLVGWWFGEVGVCEPVVGREEDGECFWALCGTGDGAVSAVCKDCEPGAVLRVLGCRVCIQNVYLKTCT